MWLSGSSLRMEETSRLRFSHSLYVGTMTMAPWESLMQMQPAQWALLAACDQAVIQLCPIRAARAPAARSASHHRSSFYRGCDRGGGSRDAARTRSSGE